ncbi:MAG: hypothetical protein ABR508_04150 [Candidatus Baltobacteraceae bacterium]
MEHDREPGQTTGETEAPGQHGDANVTRTLVWIGVAGLSAALAFTIVRSVLARQPAADPTSQRIQQLIDEANQLLKTLDDQRHSG